MPKVGQFFGRIGYFMAGCCYGAPSHLPWAVTFTNPQTLCPLKEPLHPAQLYEAFLWPLGVFGVLNIKLKKPETLRRPGDPWDLLMLAGLIRFTVEFFRASTLADPRGPEIIFHMPATQVTALGIALISGACLWWGWRRSQQA